MTLRRSASIATLRRRADLLARVRRFFAERDILEVDTASVSAAATPDPAIQSLRADGAGISGYLHTSPEYMMKRLLADGSGDIYQLCRVYRGAELGRWHEPEFMLLEWYRLGHDEHALMREVEALLTMLLGKACLRRPGDFITYDDALHRALGLTSDADTDALIQALAHHDIKVPAGATHTDALDLAMATIVCEQFATHALTFVFGYPVSQAALARINDGTRPRAARFEVFLGSLELGNGFHELTDAKEQRARFERENDARLAAGLDPVVLDEAFLAALETGLPDCSGVALGFDRIAAAAVGARSVCEVLAFTHAQPIP
jgi:lysyl-tRNA synthetase class 2